MGWFRQVQSGALYPFQCIPVRLVVGFMGFLGFINLYMTRVNLSMIVVAMVERNQSRRVYCLNNQQDILCHGNSTSDVITHGELAWDEATTGMVLSFFFYGYCFTQIPGGRLAEMFGTKRVFGAAILSSGLLTMLSPAAARLHPGALCTLRLILGLFQGVAFPSMNALIARWIPIHQRPRFISIVCFASSFGVVVTMPLCGLIIAYFSWDAAFYVTGALSVVWAAFWWLLIFDDPEDHVRITKTERDYIMREVRSTGTSETRPKKVPWKAILTSPPFWAILLADCGNSFGFTFLLTQYPTFLSSVFQFSISKSSLVSTIPFLTRYVGALLFSCLADLLVAKKLARIVVVRKALSVVAFVLPAAMIVLMILLWPGPWMVMFFVCSCTFFNGSIGSCIFVNHSDIAPNFAGTNLGVTNMMGNISGSLAPLISGLILTDQTVSQWQTVFWCCVPFYLVPEIFYLLMASGSVQPWNFHGTEEKGGQSGLHEEKAEQNAVEKNPKEETRRD